jgi:DNA-binding response OmpR family regulator/anti-sigma regulatory factor (Ser/Thr protein kinase)
MNTSERSAKEILIVEDSPTQAAGLKKLLEGDRYRVTVARDGVEAFAQIQARRPALVITDGNMPQMDGFELCRRIKAEATLRGLPVIIVTNMSEPTDVIRGLECGADNFIVKPYKPDHLLARVSYMLSAQEVQSADAMQMGVSVTFSNQRFFITADRLQILNLLLSTYEAAVQQTRDLRAAQVELEKAQRQLIETSRRAGMAEVATNVLHNVGNALNSVNISAALIADKARKSKVPNLARICSMLRENAGDLGAFLSTDPKGKQVPFFLEALAKHLTADQVSMEEEAASLAANVEHIKQIVAMQQNHGRVSGVVENLDLAGLIEDALRLHDGSFLGHELEVVRDFAPDLPQVGLDKHKVLQILISIFSNAKSACDDSGRPDKRITVRLAFTNGCVRIAVADNGVGIPPENLTRIFQLGFTTKKDGLGFGLHNAANAAREMGGSLIAHSKGPGEGASFTLELPVAACTLPIGSGSFGNMENCAA